MGVARLFGVDHDTAATGAWLATLPMWFLLVYLVVVAVAPAALVAHRRWGYAVPVGLVAVVALGDFANMALGQEWVAQVNFVAAWIAIHQVGFAWWDGRVEARPAVGWPVAVVGLATVAALTVVGPYPVSMVGVPGEDLQNTSPPTLALLALAVAQIGVVLAVRNRADAWLHRTRPWLVVVVANAVILTVFLWHTTAAIAAALLLFETGLLAPEPVGSGAWFLQRVPWIAVCAVVLAGLVVAFSWIELALPGARKGARATGAAGRWLLAVGIVAVLGAMLGIATAGPGEHGPLGLPTAAPVAYAAGMGLVAAARPRFTTD